MNTTLVFVGTYTESLPHVPNASGQGIYVYSLDYTTGELIPQNVFANQTNFLPKEQSGLNPTYLACNSKNTTLYAANETQGGTVSAFNINPFGHLTLLNRKSTSGDAACHVVMDKNDNVVIAANYATGNVAVFAVNKDDGALKEPGAIQIIQHQKQGEKQPHAHSCTFDVNGKYVLVADLGLDRVVPYLFEENRLVDSLQPLLQLDPDNGPRHIVFHPTGDFVYINMELSCKIVACSYESSTGFLQPFQTISSLPPTSTTSTTSESQQKPASAAIRIAATGKTLFVSNRFRDTITVFSIDQATGKLTYASHQDVEAIPRDFNIDPLGKFLLVAHQDSNSIATYMIDRELECLIPTKHSCIVGSPVAICFSHQI